MDSTELLTIERSVRRRYELGRVRRALLGVAPVVVILAVSLCVAHRPGSTLFFGVATLFLGALMLWYGRDPQKAVLPGIVAGLVPLGLALCANHIHVCGPQGCGTLCLPACALGGAVAGLAVASVGNRRKAGAVFWLSASALALLTGAMGCACIGYSGMIGLGLGFGVGVIPGLVRRAFAHKSTRS